MKNKKMLHSRLIDWCLTPTLAVFLAISWREVSHNRVVLKSNRQNTRPTKVVSSNSVHGEVYSIQQCDKVCQ
jgi:hypothetical protein